MRLQELVPEDLHPAALCTHADFCLLQSALLYYIEEGVVQIFILALIAALFPCEPPCPDADVWLHALLLPQSQTL